jgi:hypothetical protein
MIELMIFLSKKCKKSIGTNVIKDIRVPFLGSKENSNKGVMDSSSFSGTPVCYK